MDGGGKSPSRSDAEEVEALRARGIGGTCSAVPDDSYPQGRLKTFVEDAQPSVPYLLVSSNSRSTYTFQWSRMVEGGDWEDRALNRAVKVR